MLNWLWGTFPFLSQWLYIIYKTCPDTRVLTQKGARVWEKSCMIWWRDEEITWNLSSYFHKPVYYFKTSKQLQKPESRVYICISTHQLLIYKNLQTPKQQIFLFTTGSTQIWSCRYITFYYTISQVLILSSNCRVI